MLSNQTPDSAPKRRINRLAVTSFIFSILWLYALGSLLGLILGVVAVRRIDTATERGHGLAVAGIMLGALGLVVTAIALVILAQALSDTDFAQF